jgi:hypothetical protein
MLNTAALDHFRFVCRCKLQLFRAIVHHMSNVAAWGQRSGDRAIQVRSTLWGREIVTLFHFCGGVQEFCSSCIAHCYPFRN